MSALSKYGVQKRSTEKFHGHVMKNVGIYFFLNNKLQHFARHAGKQNLPESVKVRFELDFT